MNALSGLIQSLFFTSFKRTAMVLGGLVIALSLPVTIILVNQQQDLRQRASEKTCDRDCYYYDSRYRRCVYMSQACDNYGKPTPMPNLPGSGTIYPKASPTPVPTGSEDCPKYRSDGKLCDGDCGKPAKISGTDQTYSCTGTCGIATAWRYNCYKGIVSAGAYNAGEYLCPQGCIPTPTNTPTPPIIPKYACTELPNCAGSCSAPENTCGSAYSTKSSCVFKSHPTVGNDCIQVAAPDQSCSINKCITGYTCESNQCIKDIPTTPEGPTNTPTPTDTPDLTCDPNSDGNSEGVIDGADLSLARDEVIGIASTNLASCMTDPDTDPTTGTDILKIRNEILGIPN